MELNMKVVSREKIKPSIPTPKSQRSLKLSLLDQVAPNIYVPLLLFYPKPSNNKTTYDLKTSLSKTLSYMCPLAGKLKDGFTFECNDDGALFVETNISHNMNDVLESMTHNVMLQLLPFHPVHSSTNPSPDQVPLGVQVNTFACGKIAIGVCIWHLMGDGSTSGTFLNTWSDICRGHQIDDNMKNSFVLKDAASIFPPSTVQGFPLPTYFYVDGSPTILWDATELLYCKPTMRRFVFDSDNLTRLRDKLTAEETGRPSRVEALSVLLWSKFIEATKETNKKVKLNLFTNAINLRRRLDPPLPDNAIGNFYHENGAQWRSNEGEKTYTALLQWIQKSIRMVNNEYMHKLGPVDVKCCVNGTKDVAIEHHGMANLATSSLCRFNYYKVDFGWGQPIHVANALLVLNNAVFTDTKDGNGIEVWIALSEKDMDIIEMDTEFLSYVSSIHTL